MKRYFISLTAMLVTVGIIIAWSHFARYRQFNDYHAVIAQQATLTVASSINDMIAQRERLTRLLIEQERGDLEKLIRRPDAEAVLARLSDTVNNYFPDHFTFTITDADGKPLLEDIESLVGPICLQDLQRYMKTGEQKQRVHPSPQAYHFDVATPFDANGKKYLFFISFRTSLLGKILKTSQAHDHRLYLAMQTKAGDYLLEATANGGRDTELRDSYLLSANELQNVLSRRPIESTRWIVFDGYTDKLYSTFIAGLLTDSILYFGSFLLVVAVLSLYLFRSEQRKRAAERHKDEFLSIMSHELRTPLTAIHGSLGLLNNLNDDDSERKSSLLKMAINNTERLSALVDDILDLQKMETGKMQYQMTELHLNELLLEAVRGIQSFASEAGTGIETDLLDKDIIIHGDRQRLMQVMFNLLSNAIKYGAEHDTILVTSRLMDNGRIRISIIDHGEGIPEPFRQRMFEKFSQADSSSSRKYPGTGLGLSIVKLIVEEHQGEVGFESKPDEGSQFYFELPYSDYEVNSR